MRRAAAIIAAAASLVLAEAGCRGREKADQASHPRDPELRRLVQRALAMHEGLAGAASRAGSDCVAMARGMSEVVEAHRDVLAAAEELQADDALRGRFEQLVDDQAAKRYSDAVLQYAEASAPCDKDLGVSRAMAPLEHGDPLRVD